jgi:hypothetical protein
VVHYRNIRIQELPDTPVDPQDVAVADRGFRCLYTGLDLGEWTAAPEAIPFWQPRDWRLAFEGATAAAASSALSTRESFGDFGFIVDVRVGENGQGPRILARGAEAAGVTLDASDPLAAPHLARAGRWNRLEGNVRGDRLTLTLNGQELVRDKPIAGLPERGPLQLAPRGPVEFANIYVRGLQ